MSKNILVTGAAGFIGSNLCDYLVENDWNVLGIDNLMQGYRSNIEHLEKRENFKFIWADVRDYKKMDFILKNYKIECISHQAARGSVPKSIEDPILTHEINTTGTLNVFWATVQNNVKNVVCAISSSVYGDTPTLPKVETMNYNPLSPYAVTKAAKEMYCKVFYELYGLRTIGLRYFNVYGKRQDPNGDYAAVIPRWITKALNNENLPVNGEGKQTRDFTYIDDVVQANIKSLTCENKEAFGKGYNIGYSDITNIVKLGETIIREIGSDSKIEYLESRKGDIQDSYADINLARKYLGYDPKYNLEEGLKKTIEWYRSNIK